MSSSVSSSRSKRVRGNLSFTFLNRVVYTKQNNSPLFPLSSVQTGTSGGQGNTVSLSSCSLWNERLGSSPFFNRRIAPAEFTEEVSFNKVGVAHGYNFLKSGEGTEAPPATGGVA